MKKVNLEISTDSKYDLSQGCGKAAKKLLVPLTKFYGTVVSKTRGDILLLFCFNKTTF